MTFLRYSIFISPSLLLVTGESGREEPDGREDGEDGEDKEALTSGVLAKLQ